jgi:hypothetical protein
MTVFVPPPMDDQAFAGLKPIARVPEDAARVKAKHASPLTLDRATFDVAKVADHADVLFPFLRPGLSWDYLALVPERDHRCVVTRLMDRPLATLGSARLGRAAKQSTIRRLGV